MSNILLSRIFRSFCLMFHSCVLILIKTLKRTFDLDQVLLVAFLMKVLELIVRLLQVLIFQTFLERRFGSQRGIVLTSLLFAICHIPSHFLNSGIFLGSFSIMLVFYGSLLFGYVWYRTRNLWVISGAHMLNNSNATIIYNFLN